MVLTRQRDGKKARKKARQADKTATATADATPPQQFAAIPVAHFVFPAYKLANAKRGEEVKSVCGNVVIKGDAHPNAPVCQDCVLAQMDLDDKKTADATTAAAAFAERQATRRHEDGIRIGERQGQDKAMQTLREAAERRAGEVKQAVPT